MKVLKNLFIFSLGAAIGSAATYYYTKDMYEKINKEEQEELLKHYGVNRPEEIEKVEEAKHMSTINRNKPDISSYSKIAENYTNYSSVSKKEEPPIIKKEEKTMGNIKVIDIDDYGTEGYEVKTVTLYTDGIITDEDDEVINRDKYLGSIDLEDILLESDYGDSVYIRNEDLNIDIEVIKDTMSYADSPYPFDED